MIELSCGVQCAPSSMPVLDVAILLRLEYGAFQARATEAATAKRAAQPSGAPRRRRSQLSPLAGLVFGFAKAKAPSKSPVLAHSSIQKFSRPDQCRTPSWARTDIIKFITLYHSDHAWCHSSHSLTSSIAFTISKVSLSVVWRYFVSFAVKTVFVQNKFLKQFFVFF